MNKTEHSPLPRRRQMRNPFGIYRGRGQFCCYWWFVGWWALSFGFHLSLKEPNVEIHLPFGFIRIGIEQ